MYTRVDEYLSIILLHILSIVDALLWRIYCYMYFVHKIKKIKKVKPKRIKDDLCIYFQIKCAEKELHK